jgi:hypothetical protein
MTRTPRSNRTRAKQPAASRSISRTEAQILDALDRTLSEREIQLVLTRGLRALGREGQQRLFARLAPDTAGIVRAVLDRSSKSRAARPLKAGREKLKEDWKALWCEWGDCIAESGSEDGKYVYQDADWEPPYLDQSGVMNDLERIAGRMRPLLARVWDEELDPELSFADALEAAAHDIGAGLPEWIEPVDPGQFGRETTACLLEWQWRSAQREGADPYQFAEGICNLEQSLEAGLDDDSIAVLHTMFDEGDQRAILRGLAEHRQAAPWSVVLSNPHSGWFRLHQQLARKWDQALFAEVSRANIARDFTLALPLLTERLRKKSYGEALVLVDGAVRAMLRLDAGKTWDPRSGLLVRHREILMRGGVQPAQVKLLGAWHRAACGLGRQDVTAALDLQLVVARHRDDWNAVLAAFRNTSVPCDPLFADWRLDASERSIGAAGWTEKSTEPTWVHWLIDAMRADEPGLFMEPVRQWLADPRGAPMASGRRRSAFATLALDVDGGGELERRYPTLHRLLSRERDGVREVDAVRRQWLGRLGGFALLPDVLACCRTHARRLVPDPADACASNYEECATWMAAIRELDPDVCRAILAAWSVAHKRRRNLWQALASRRLPPA